MRNAASLIVALCLAVASARVGRAEPVFDGLIAAGEWDAYFLGTGTHMDNWGSGDYVTCNVYAYHDASYLYAAWQMVDCTTASWDTAKAVGVEANFYLKCPSSVSYPQPGYDLFDMKAETLKQTDGTGWSEMGPLSANGIVYGYTHESTPSRIGVGEFKIPWSAFTNGQQFPITLTGQYWGNGFDTNPVFYDYASQPPVANSDGPYRILVGDGLTLDGSGSSDPDGGSIMDYLWSVGALSYDAGTNAISNFTWPELGSLFGITGNGVYTFRLTVTDDEGDTAFAETTLTVVPEPLTLCLLGGALAGLARRRRRLPRV